MAYIFVLLLFILSCKRAEILEEKKSYYTLDIPQGFPYPSIPIDNELTQPRIALGEKLFFDVRLSLDSSISCASCHFPSKAFSDVVPVSYGVYGREGKRNSPPLFNVAYKPYFFKDGGIPNLELQIPAPIEDHLEMSIEIPVLIERLKQIPEYNRMSKIAYNVDEISPFVLTRALSSYERTLISGNSKYDQYMRGELELTESELRGMNLFFSDSLACNSCHDGFNFTNYSFQNNGLYNFYSDSGRARITLNPQDNGKFVVPSLRNVELTAPYMFDGSLETLEDVIDHYNNGGVNYPTKSELIKSLGLSPEEKEDIISFLKSLTDWDFVERHKNDGN